MDKRHLNISFRRAMVERWLHTLIDWGFDVLSAFHPLLWVPVQALSWLCSVLDFRSFRETCSCSVEMMLQYWLEMSLINNKYQHCWLLRLRYAQMWYLSDGYVVKNQMVAVVNNFKQTDSVSICNQPHICRQNLGHVCMVIITANRYTWVHKRT